MASFSNEKPPFATVNQVNFFQTYLYTSCCKNNFTPENCRNSNVCDISSAMILLHDFFSPFYQTPNVTFQCFLNCHRVEQRVSTFETFQQFSRRLTFLHSSTTEVSRCFSTRCAMHKNTRGKEKQHKQRFHSLKILDRCAKLKQPFKVTDRFSSNVQRTGRISHRNEK